MNCKKTLILATGLVLVLAADRLHEARRRPALPRRAVDAGHGPEGLGQSQRHQRRGLRGRGRRSRPSLMKYDGTPSRIGPSPSRSRDAGRNPIKSDSSKGREAVTRQTDGGGNVSLTYYGPLDSDIARKHVRQYLGHGRPRKAIESIENFTPVDHHPRRFVIGRHPAASSPTPTSSRRERRASTPTIWASVKRAGRRAARPTGRSISRSTTPTTSASTSDISRNRTPSRPGDERAGNGPRHLLGPDQVGDPEEPCPSHLGFDVRDRGPLHPELRRDLHHPVI